MAFALPKHDPTKPAPDRIFWMTMTYKCDCCQSEALFYLEQGCEGPKTHTVAAKTTEGHPIGAGRDTTMSFTGHGRAIVPVPMIAGKCPHCKGGTKRGPFGVTKTGFLIHVRWNEDRILDPPMRVLGHPNFAHFLYPTAAEKRRRGAMAPDCGRPVYQTSQVVRFRGARGGN